MKENDELSGESLIAVSVFTATLALFLSTAYRYSLIDYVNLVRTEEYSYLLVVAGALATIFYAERSFLKLSNGLSAPKLLSSASLLTTSYTSLLLSNVVESGSMMLKGFALVTLIWGLMALILSTPSLKRLLAPTFMLSFLIPVPMEVLDPLANSVSLATARLASFITGAALEESQGMYTLSARDPFGILRSFNVMPICGGVVSLLSVLAVSVIPIYLILKSSRPIRFKLLAITASVLAGVAVEFFGNALRVLGIIWITRSFGYSAAMAYFNEAPSAIYVFLAVLASAYLASRTLRPYRTKAVKRPFKHLENPKDRMRTSAAVLIVALSFLALFSYVSPSAQQIPPGGQRSELHIKLSELMGNAGNVILKGVGRLISIRNAGGLAEVLGASTVKEFTLDYRGNYFKGYLEVAESPERYHSWSVCLTYQRYLVLKSWSSELGNRTITFVEFRKGMEEMILGYSTYQYPIMTRKGREYAYVRVSLIANNSKLEPLVVDALTSIRAQQPSIENPYGELMSWVYAVEGLFLLMLAYVIYLIYSFIRGRPR